ncbi:MAG: hypothetical protein E7616_06685 [Ruminococcaceae bacterium]|nr:hypothetical protein [Oscillospiraceae bacterium]
MTGEFVVSLSGRDKGRIHVIVAYDTEKGIIYFCDGKTRKMERPKPKKLKHVKFVSYRDELLASAIEQKLLTDRMIREAIARYEMKQSRRDCSAEG